MSTRVSATRRTANPGRRDESGAPSAPRPPWAPLVFGKRSESVPRVPLFSVDGDEYTVPETVETGEALGLLAVVKSISDDRARGAFLIRELCGVDALKALYTEASFTPDDWATLVRTLWQHAFGPLEREDESGN